MKLTVSRFIACSTLAAVLAGCGGGATFDKPKVADGAVVAIAVGDVWNGKLVPALKKVGLSSNLLLKQFPGDVQELLAKAGLEKIEPRWSVLSVGGLKGVVDGKVPRVAFAMAFPHDLPRIVSAVEEEAKKEEAQFKQVTVADVPAWEIHCDDFKSGDTTVVPCIASLDGQVLLVTSSTSVMEQQIALYRDGKDESRDFADFTVTPDDILKVSVAKVGDSIRESMGDSLENLTLLDEMIPDGDKMLLGIGTAQVSLSAASDSEVNLAIALKMSSEEDADKVRTLAKTGLMAATAQVKKNLKNCRDADEAATTIFESLRKVKIGGENASAELVLSVPAEPILEVYSKALDNAQEGDRSAAQAMRGRNLFVGIIQSSTEREAAGFPSVWPRTRDGKLSDDKEDISGIAFKNAVEFFNELFDAKKVGKADWSPYVEGVEAQVAMKTGAGKFSGSFKASQLAWSIAANVADEMDDVVPVLVSSNFDPSQLLGKWDGVADAERLLKTTDGAPLVIVRKGGATEVIKPRYCTYSTIYKRKAFETPRTFAYLTPEGIAVPRR